MPYIKNKESIGKLRKNQHIVCKDLNREMEIAIECFELDRIAFLERLLKEKSCKVNRASERFLNRFRDA